MTAELAVGTLEETVTVSGASPIVDVRNSVSQSVMSREVLDTIPSGKDPFAVGQLIAGVTTATPDVGGTQIMQQPTLQVHGSSNNDNVFMIDNVQIQHIGFGGNQTGFYFNDGLMDEISYQTSSLPAEAPVGGVQINMIPRDGGNQYHGGLFATGANSSMQSDNLDDELEALGFAVQNRVDTIYDFNATFGGPIKRDRLWFFSTFRRWAANNFLGNTFTATGEQALDDQRISDVTLRMTGQLNQKNKLTLHYDRSIKWRGHRPNNWIGASINDPISSVEQTTGLNYIGQLKWSSPISNRLMAEASVFTLAGQLQPVVPARRGPRRRRHLRPDPVARHRRLAAAGHQHGTHVDLCGVRVVRLRRAQLQGRPPAAHRRIRGALRDAPGHRPDRQQRRAQFRAPGEQPQRTPGVGRQHRLLRAGLVDVRPRHHQPGAALRAVHDVHPAAKRRCRPLGARA